MAILKTCKIIFYAFLLLTAVGVVIVLVTSKVNLSLDWHKASRASAKIAPLPTQYKDAVVQVYGARTYGTRGIFAMHTWLAAKAKNASTYKIYQVIGWLKYYGLPALSVTEDIPDRMWFGQKPELLKDVRGHDAEKIIEQLDKVVNAYPYSEHYYYWPGPNSNTFIAYLAKNIPELQMVMPPLAIGKDFLGWTKFREKTPSGTGCQFSFYGIFGFIFATDEGFEFNILGGVIGINIKKRAIILPAVGYIHFL